MGIALWICCGKRRIVVLGPRLERRTIAHPTVTHDLQTDDPGRPPARHTRRAAGAALAPGERFAPFGAAADGDGDRRLDELDVSADEEDPTLGGGRHAGTGTAAARFAVASAMPWITIGATTGSSSEIIFAVGSSWPCSARTFAARSCATSS